MSKFEPQKANPSYKIANPKASAHIKNTVLKILEKQSDIDEDQKAAMEEFCKCKCNFSATYVMKDL